jgi:thioredoxin-dependent peroxiredoxin
VSLVQERIRRIQRKKNETGESVVKHIARRGIEPKNEGGCMTVTTGEQAPQFCLPDSDGNQVCLNDYLGSWVILYFYPKDNTPGCTLEAVQFSGYTDEIMKMGAAVLGVSPDSPGSHCRFRDRHDLRLTLLSDEKHNVLELYDAWTLKRMAGREYHGVQRSTFLVNPDGEVVRVWPEVKVKGHAEEVVKVLKSLLGQ